MRTQIRSLVRKTGYEVHRSTRECFVKDAFADQRALLSGERVERIFDVGAHRGETAARYIKLFPKATVYGFEPFPDSIAELRRKFENEPSVMPFQLAVSGSSGSQSFYVNRDSFTNSLLPALDREGYDQIATLDVSSTTIDEFCEDESIDDLSILKMDIQGGELRALEGASRMLKRAAISIIYTEILFAPLYRGQAFFYEIYDLLSSHRYSLFDLYNFAYRQSGQVAWADAIFVSPGLQARLQEGDL